MADRVDKFDDWWREVGYAQIPRADELPAYASIARLAWTAALALPAETHGSEYESGFKDGVNCACTICSERRSELKKALGELPAASATPPSEPLYEILRQGKDLVESTLAHVSHGGPTREEAEKWLADAKIALQEPDAAPQP